MYCFAPQVPVMGQATARSQEIHPDPLQGCQVHQQGAGSKAWSSQLSEQVLGYGGEHPKGQIILP